MLISSDIVVACFCFKTSLINFDRSSFFDIAIFLLCIASGAKLSFAAVINLLIFLLMVKFSNRVYQLALSIYIALWILFGQYVFFSKKILSNNFVDIRLIGYRLSLLWALLLDFFSYKFPIIFMRSIRLRTQIFVCSKSTPLGNLEKT